MIPPVYHSLGSWLMIRSTSVSPRLRSPVTDAKYTSTTKTIIVKAETEAHGEILELVGASKVVFPNKEAAKRITPLLLSSVLLNYFPVSRKLVIVELEIPSHLIGKSTMEVDIRRQYNLNLIYTFNIQIKNYF